MDASSDSSVSDLGRYAAGFASFRRMLAEGENTLRPTIFRNVAAEAAGYVVQGLDRGVAAKTLTQMATTYGLDNAEAIIANAFTSAHDRRAGSNGSAGEQSSPPPEPRPFTLKAFNDIKMSTASSCLVRGIIPGTGLVVVWGEPKCGKSFWTFDLLMHVALGRDYRSHRVRQGAVVYLALEGGHGFAKRVEAWRKRHLADDPGAVPFWLLDAPVDVIADRDRLISAVKAQLGEVKPAVVVIDTLNRGLNGSENEPKYMARFIQASDTIRNAFGCVVIIVHHCGIEGTRPRGHTSLAGAADAQIAVARGTATDTITVTVEWMKDDEPGEPLTCRLERVELGTDDEGEPITSCIVVETDNAAAGKRVKLSAMQKLARDQLKEVAIEMGVRSGGSKHIPPGVTVVPKEVWRKYFYNKHPSDDPDNKRKAFVRAVEKLQELQLVGLWEDQAWLPDMPDMAGH
jgi:hypothetical protein